MKMLKQLFSAALSALLLLTITAPTYALELPPAPPVNIAQARYANIYQVDCTLSLDSSGSATAGAWVAFVPGEDCTVKLVLKKDGRQVYSWSKKSSTGSINLSKSVTGLSAGKYQAVMTVECGSDSDTISSTTETLY